MPTYTTVVGWAALIAVGAFFYFTWPAKSSGKRGRAASKVVPRQQFEALRAPKAKRSKKDGDQSSGDQSGERKKKTVKPGPEEKWSIVDSAPQAPDHDDDLDNREFARQLTNAKAGTLLPAKSKVGTTKQRSVKQGQAQEKPVETSSDATAGSSAAGADADDDRSSFNSPELSATAVEVPVTNGGISDMLEAPAPGPSVLKVTAPTNPVQSKKARPQAAPEPAETKKQRQNRKKAELKKAAREEEEEERKVLLEKQRRTAREAEGRAAKDGSAFMATKTPANNAWTAPQASTSSNAGASKGKSIDLLDTFNPATTKAAEVHNSGSEQASSDWQKLASTLPSEEEQLRLALEDSDNWETVQSKEQRKAKKATKPTQQEEKKGTASEKENQHPAPAQHQHVPTAPGKKWEMHLESSDEDGNVHQYVKIVQDSEWEVA